MTLRLSVVIDGDNAGAKAAMDDTRRGMEELGQAANTTASAGKHVSSTLTEFTGGVDKANDALEKAAPNAGDAANALRSIDEAGRNAAKGIGEFAQRGGETVERLSGLKNLLIGAAGGLAASVGVGLVTEGFKAAAGAVADYVHDVTSAQPEIERALKSQQELIGGIKAEWAEAKGAASDYGETSRAQLRFDAQQNLLKADSARTATLDDLPSLGEGSRGIMGGPFGESIRKFNADLEQGVANVRELRREIAATASNLPADSPLRQTAQKLLDRTAEAAKAEAEFKRASDLLKLVEGNAEAGLRALGGAQEKWSALADDVPPAATAIGDANAQIDATAASAGAAVVQLEAYDRLMKSIGTTRVPASAFPTPERPEGYEAGGFTGTGSPSDPAGIVHRGEYVFDAAATRRIGVRNLEAMRRGSLPGYAGGGYAGSDPWEGARTPSSPAGGGWWQEGVAELRGAFQGITQALIRGGQSVEDVLRGVGASLADRLINSAFDMFEQLLNGAFSGGGAAGGGGMFGGIMKWIMSLFGFAGGGYTGDGGRLDPAGVVHRGEYVFDAASTRRIGVPALEAMRQGALPGYAGGGPVATSAAPGWGGGRTYITLNDQNNNRVSTRSERQPNGDEQIEILLEQMDARMEAGLAGGRFDDALGGRYGARPVLT